jgi:hypothetical protein
MKLKKDIRRSGGIVIKNGSDVRVATEAEIDAANASVDHEIAAALRSLVRQGKIVAFVPEGSSEVVYASSQNFDV